jgi:hypothetical protein
MTSFEHSGLDVGNVIKRHQDFWNRNNSDRPLFGFPLHWEHTFGQKIGFEPGVLTPDKLDPQLFVSLYEEQLKNVGVLEGDLLKVASATFLPWAEKDEDGATRYRTSMPAYFPWSEAIGGCQVQVMADAIWATGPADGNVKPPTLDSLKDNPWLLKLLEITELLNEKFGGKYPVAPTMLRGPADMVAAILGTEKMCLDMVDFPEKVKALFETYTKIWLEAEKMVKKTFVKYHDGYCDARFQLWSPDIIRATQEDCAMFFSPKNYSKFLIDLNRSVAASAPYMVIHTHSAALRTIKPLAEIKELSAIQLNIDPKGPSVSDIIAVLDDVIKQKPVILFKPFKRPEVEELLEKLPAEGLCIVARYESEPAAVEFIKSVMGD